MDDEKKLELVAGMGPQKVMALRKVSHSTSFDRVDRDATNVAFQRVTDLQAAGHTKDNSSELGKLTMVLELYSRAKQLEWVFAVIACCIA